MEKIETEMVQDKQCHEETETWTEQILEKVKSHSCLIPSSPKDQERYWEKNLNKNWTTHLQKNILRHYLNLLNCKVSLSSIPCFIKPGTFNYLL
jgi:hypothetical protein